MAGDCKKRLKCVYLSLILCSLQTYSVVNALQRITVSVIHMTDPPEESEFYEESHPEFYEDFGPTDPFRDHIAATFANHTRRRRAAFYRAPDFSRLSPSACSRKIAALKNKHAGQVALVVKLGHDTKLPCHQCKRRSEPSMNWYRLDREVISDGDGGVAWRPLEVKLDKYDDWRLNRVYVNPSHQLVIKDFQPNDVGSYFCMRYNKKEQKKLSKIAFKSTTTSGGGAAGAAAAWSGVRNNDMIEMVVHMDIEIPKKEMLVGRNLLLFTEWERWSRCSQCGNAGNRRRRGNCFVRRLNGDRAASPKHLDRTLMFYPKGAPCHSSLFESSDLHDIEKRPPEVELERCEVRCKNQDTKGLLNRLNFLKKKKKKKKFKMKKKEFQRMEGEEMRLLCPGTFDDTPVVWMNDSERMNPLDLPIVTKKRVKIDFENALFFQRLILTDSGKYTCAFGVVKRAKYKIKVIERPVKMNVGPYLRILFQVFLGDFVIFLVLLGVRHKQRLVQVHKPKARAKARRPQARATAPQPQAIARVPAPQPQASATAPQPQASATALQPQASATALQPQASATALQPQASATAPQPQASVTTPQPQASATAPQPQASATAPQPQASKTAPQPQAEATAPQPQVSATAPQPQPGPVERTLKVPLDSSSLSSSLESADSDDSGKSTE